MAKSSNPYRASVQAEISIHAALDAVEHFAAHYPAERLDDLTAARLARAATVIRQRVAADRFNKISRAMCSAPE